MKRCCGHRSGCSREAVPGYGLCAKHQAAADRMLALLAPANERIMTRLRARV